MPEMCKNGIENNNLNDLFSENDKTHKIKTRAVEKYKVQHANTERLKNHKSNAENVESWYKNIRKCKKNSNTLMVIVIVIVVLINLL